MSMETMDRYAAQELALQERWAPVCEAALLEGWALFERDSTGELELCRDDCPDPIETPQGEVIPPTLDDDAAAWAIVRQGTGEHHRVALELLREFNPQEFERVTSAS